VSTTAQAFAISVSLGVTSVDAITNASVDAMAMVSTMKKMAIALQEEQPGSSLVNAFIPGLPWLAKELVKVPWLV
jgi:hypothetical protein